VLRKYLRFTFSAGVSLAMVSLAFAGSAFADEKRHFDTRASIEMSYFGTLFASQPFDVDDDGILSPDERQSPERPGSGADSAGDDVGGCERNRFCGGSGKYHMSGQVGAR